MKRCKKCLVEQPLSEFGAHGKTKDGIHFRCFSCRRAEVLAAYGATCDCCGERELRFLCVDHVNGDGASHRKQLGAGNKNALAAGSAKFYRWLKKNDFPKDRFRLLCHNCNIASGTKGVCPHSAQQREYAPGLAAGLL